MKRMKHPQHGWTHAYNPNEEAYLRNLGWGDDVPELKIAVDLESGAVVEVPVADVPVKRGPGRPRKVITDKE